jgi:hypothetical protein
MSGTKPYKKNTVLTDFKITHVIHRSKTPPSSIVRKNLEKSGRVITLKKSLAQAISELSRPLLMLYGT